MIEQFTSAKSIHDRISELKRQGKKIGFVPTMGALHFGHMTLISKAVEENDVVVCSIFVNPKQFNNPEDLAKYPRTLDEDLKMLAQHKCELVFVPSVEEVYPEEISLGYNFGSLELEMEGKHRPGHFNGMAIVVKRLFDIVTPNRAYFGDKDYQQLLIVKKLVEIEQLPIEIIGCEISREPSGLAMSSRNKRLTNLQKNQAAVIFKELTHLAHEFKSDLKWVDELIKDAINRVNQLDDFEVEYISLVDENTMLPYQNGEKMLNPHLFAGVKVGNVRLIDNLPIIV